MDFFTQSVFYIFNFCEAILWISIGVGCAVVLIRKRKSVDLMLVTSFLFLAFGVSDFVEMKTGGWYKPWWLLLWKASCLLGLAVIYLMFHRRAAKPGE
jgi:hypothetical protein